MKHKILIGLLLLSTAIGYAQANPQIIYAGGVNNGTVYKGVLGAEGALLAPEGNHDEKYPDLTNRRRIQLNIDTKKFEGHNGTEWVEFDLEKKLKDSLKYISYTYAQKADLVNGKVPLTQINDALLGAVNYQGTYNAATNTPALPNATTNKGKYWVVNIEGTQQGANFKVGDWVISNGVVWGRVPKATDVDSFPQIGSNNAVSSDGVAFEFLKYAPKDSPVFTNKVTLPNNLEIIGGSALNLLRGDGQVQSIQGTVRGTAIGADGGVSTSINVNDGFQNAIWKLQNQSNLKALDADVLHKTGSISESVTGQKTFSDYVGIGSAAVNTWRLKLQGQFGLSSVNTSGESVWELYNNAKEIRHNYGFKLVGYSGLATGQTWFINGVDGSANFAGKITTVAGTNPQEVVVKSQLDTKADAASVVTTNTTQGSIAGDKTWIGAQTWDSNGNALYQFKRRIDIANSAFAAITSVSKTGAASTDGFGGGIAVQIESASSNGVQTMASYRGVRQGNDTSGAARIATYLNGVDTERFEISPQGVAKPINGGTLEVPTATTNAQAVNKGQMDAAIAGKADTSALNAKANIASPTFTGDAKAVTPFFGDNDNSIATTKFMQDALAAYTPNVGAGHNSNNSDSPTLVLSQYFLGNNGSSSILVDASLTNKTVILPENPYWPNKMLRIVKTDNTANTVTIIPFNNIGTISGQPNVVLSTAYQTATIEQCGGTLINWK